MGGRRLYLQSKISPISIIYESGVFRFLLHSGSHDNLKTSICMRELSPFSERHCLANLLTFWVLIYTSRNTENQCNFLFEKML